MNDRPEVALVSEVGFGNRDVGYPILWFTLALPDGWAALQVFSGDDALRVVKDSGVYNVSALNGKACFVRRDGNIVRFERWWMP